MKIEKLKQKRQHNVQEQNALQKHKIIEAASYWRNKGIPEGLEKAFCSKGINSQLAILLNYKQDFPGCSTDEGIVLTNDGQFYQFDVDLSKDRKAIVEIYEIVNITDDILVAKHHRATGVTWGYLALEVLKELNDVSYHI